MMMSKIEEQYEHIRNMRNAGFITAQQAAEQEKHITDIHNEIVQKDMLINELTQEIAKLHNQKAKLEKWSSDVSQHNASLMDEIVGDRSRSIERARLSLYRGAAIGLFIGLSISYLFL